MLISASAITVNKADLTLTADGKSKVPGTANPTFASVFTGFVGWEDLGTSGIAGDADFTTAATNGSPAAAYAIIASLGTLTVTAAPSGGGGGGGGIVNTPPPPTQSTNIDIPRIIQSGIRTAETTFQSMNRFAPNLFAKQDAFGNTTAFTNAAPSYWRIIYCIHLNNYRYTFIFFCYVYYSWHIA